MADYKFFNSAKCDIKKVVVAGLKLAKCDRKKVDLASNNIF